ncbi:hypothetical protein CR513_30665, partial [Mucuna pruriens]
MLNARWSEQLDGASERTIRWYPHGMNENRCRGFLNIPLLGTQTAINYNPELTSRQAGYPMIRAPPEETIGARSCRASAGYRNWLRDRVRQVRLPRNRPRHQDGKTQADEILELLKTEELQAALEHMEAEQGSLKRKLEVALIAQASTRERTNLEQPLNESTSKKA